MDTHTHTHTHIFIWYRVYSGDDIRKSTSRVHYHNNGFPQ